MKPIIGLEIHVQLKTASKMFCSCSAQYFGAKPNTHMCPVCLALPGALPVANKKALENAVKVGLVLHCTINKFSKFDRKNYMYPDLFKGYQITQYAIPICENGYVDMIRTDGSSLRVGIIRAHQEEDTAKSIHEKTYTLVDGNKAGVPLLEIVSEPDMRSVEDAKLYAEYIYNTLRFVGVSDCDMEKGQLRFDVNVNIEIEQTDKKGDVELIATPIVEIKNLNSFRMMERALQYEIKRQEEEYKKTGITFKKGNKTTRGWNDAKGETFLLRSKEEAEDYRYFPEPDLPPVIFTEKQIEALRKDLGLLPSEVYDVLSTQDHLNADTAKFFSSSRVLYAYLEKGRTQYTHMTLLANWIKGNVIAYIYAHMLDPDDIDQILPVENLIALLKLLDAKKISSTSAKEVLELMLATQKDAQTIIDAKGLMQITDTDVLDRAIEKILTENTSAIDNFKSGKIGAMMFLVGQVMKEIKGQGNPEAIKAELEKRIAS